MSIYIALSFLSIAASFFLHQSSPLNPRQLIYFVVFLHSVLSHFLSIYFFSRSPSNTARQ